MGKNFSLSDEQVNVFIKEKVEMVDNSDSVSDMTPSSPMSIFTND